MFSATCAHDLRVGLDEVHAAHAGLARQAGGDDDDVGALGALVGAAADADDLGLEALDRPRLVHVQRDALGLALDDVGEHDGLEDVVLGETERGGGAVETGADDGDLALPGLLCHGRQPSAERVAAAAGGGQGYGIVSTITVSASPVAGEQDDVDRPAADGEEPDPPDRQEQPQHGGADQRQPDDDEPAAPVVEGDHAAARRRRRRAPPAAAAAGAARRGTAGGRRAAAAVIGLRRGSGSQGGRRCSAARTTFCSSIARVIGPTPPGLGATCPATSTTSAATSPAILPSTRLTPTSRTAAPGLTMSAVIRPGTPAAATTMSAPRDVRGEVARAGVAQRHGGVLRRGG